MALISFKMAASLVVAVLLLATPQARGCALLEDDEVMPDDMVPVQKPPAEQVVVTIPGGAAETIMAGISRSPICLQCRCCSRSNPGTCQTTTCCSSFKCDRGGRCTLVQDKCGCDGCGAAH